ncbi:MAG TPA: lysozyme inhibitor LprI family protein [Rhizomicrobium sp.]
MNRAYAGLLKVLPAEAGSRLQAAQRAWLAFRDTEAKARSALYETRRGTMYVPMQAASTTSVVRDRAFELEASLRVMRIDD